MLKENMLYKLADAPGGYYLFARGKLMRLETFEHLAEWLLRVRGEFPGFISQVTRADLLGHEVFNFKGEKIADQV